MLNFNEIEKANVLLQDGLNLELVRHFDKVWMIIVIFTKEGDERSWGKAALDQEGLEKAIKQGRDYFK